MGIKELKGRSLPGRSEEPSPDRPTTAISEAEGKRAATEQQRERSEFEQRKREKARPRSGKKEGAEGRSEFEAAGRPLPRPEEPAGDLERYPHPPVGGGRVASDWLEGFGNRPVGEERGEEGSTPDLWGDSFGPRATADADSTPEDRWGGEGHGEEEDEPGAPYGTPEEEALLPLSGTTASSAPVAGDLWEATAAPGVPPPALVTPSFPSAAILEAKPEVIPTRETVPAADAD